MLSLWSALEIKAYYKCRINMMMTVDADQFSSGFHSDEHIEPNECIF